MDDAPSSVSTTNQGARIIDEWQNALVALKQARSKRDTHVLLAVVRVAISIAFFWLGSEYLELRKAVTGIAQPRNLVIMLLVPPAISFIWIANDIDLFMKEHKTVKELFKLERDWYAQHFNYAYKKQPKPEL